MRRSKSTLRLLEKVLSDLSKCTFCIVYFMPASTVICRGVLLIFCISIKIIQAGSPSSSTMLCRARFALFFGAVYALLIPLQTQGHSVKCKLALCTITTIHREDKRQDSGGGGSGFGFVKSREKNILHPQTTIQDSGWFVGIGIVRCC